MTDQHIARPVSRPTTIIEPVNGWQAIALGELWQFRDLLYFLVWRNIKVRYKQTILGASWAILQPFTTMVVFSIFFGGMAKMPSDGIPYPVFSFTGLVPWTFFQTGVIGLAGSIVGSSGMLKKIYFPRIIVPLSQLGSTFVDFVLAFAVLLGMIAVYSLPGVAPDGNNVSFSANVIWLPLLLLLAAISALGVGLWLAALNVQFRDVNYATGFMLRLWMFITPVIYPTSLVNSDWRIIYSLNPMAGVIEGFRWALLGTGTAPGPMILMSAAVALVLLVSGIFYFGRMEKSFADVI